MPDPVLMLEAMGVAAVAAALVFLLFGNAARGERPALSACGWVLGLGLGSWLGFLVLGLRPRWPLSEDLDRFLALVFPAFLGVEVLISILRWPPAPRWLARGLVAALAAPALLYGSSYLSDVAGPGTREWPPVAAVLILGAAGAWHSSGRGSWSRRRHAVARPVPSSWRWPFPRVERPSPFCSPATPAAGRWVSPLAAALAGSRSRCPSCRRSPSRPSRWVPGWEAVFSLLVIGRFFASLTTAHAVLLFLAPLLGAAVVLLLRGRWGPRVRFAVSLLPVVVLVGRSPRLGRGEIRGRQRVFDACRGSFPRRLQQARIAPRHPEHPRNTSAIPRTAARRGGPCQPLRRRRLLGRARLLPSGLVQLRERRPASERGSRRSPRQCLGVSPNVSGSASECFWGQPVTPKGTTMRLTQACTGLTPKAPEETSNSARPRGPQGHARAQHSFYPYVAHKSASFQPCTSQVESAFVCNP